MKRLQSASMRLIRPEARARASESRYRQNRFARRHGLTWLKLSVNLFLASVAITATYQFVLYLQANGSLERPHSLDRLVRDQAPSGS